MKIDVRFPELEAQRKRLGAKLSDWKIGSTLLNPREELLIELGSGIEINLDEVEVGPGGLLAYQGKQITLYIKDTGSSHWILKYEPENSRRFHITDCQTLRKMRRQGRFERYVVANRTDGLFLVDWLDPDTQKKGSTEAALKVCKNCLNSLNWQGYTNPQDRMRLSDGTRQDRKSIWDGFSISEFFMEYSTFFHILPSRRDITAVLNEYVKNWPKISRQKRRAAAWRCEQCSVDLSQHPNLLHCHHKSGVVTDNSASNLRVLCALCHALQPYHQHMGVSAARSKINKIREAQGMPPG